MARPPDADPAVTYERILAAAIDEVRETDPPTAISMRAVATRAGVSLGTLQYYFPTKEALLEGCLDGYHTRLAAMAQRLAVEVQGGQVPPGRPTVEHVMRSLYRFARVERAFGRLRVITTAQRGELPPERQGALMGDMIVEAARVLRPHVTVAERDVRLAVALFAASLFRLAGMSSGEAARLTETETSADADRVLEEYLVRAACRLVRPGDDDPAPQ